MCSEINCSIICISKELPDSFEVVASESVECTCEPLELLCLLASSRKNRKMKGREAPLSTDFSREKASPEVMTMMLI